MTGAPRGKDFSRFLREDRTERDLTSQAILPPRFEAVGDLVAQGSGVVSGIAEAAQMAREAGLQVRAMVRDGDRVRRGNVLLRVSGSARTVLGVERTLVNLVMHLSGVATATSRLVAAAGRPGFRIAATRKTLPGLRDLEKAAVVHGGGEPHRRDLSSAILIKGNHQRLVGFHRALRLAGKKARERRVELMVEVGNPEEALEAVKGGARRILVDNRSPREVGAVLDALERKGKRKTVTVEVTGGITERNVRAYARTGADLASSGQLTHSAPALPMHLVVRPKVVINKGAYDRS